MKVAVADHKHYVCFNETDVAEAEASGYAVVEMTKDQLFESWQKSNSLRFINDWALKMPPIVRQFASADEARANIDALTIEE